MKKRTGNMKSTVLSKIIPSAEDVRIDEKEKDVWVDIDRSRSLSKVGST